MTRLQLHQFKTILEAKQSAVASALLENRRNIVVEKSADVLEEVSYMADRELAIASLNQYSGLFRNIRTALARIEEGEFGTCLRCGEAIGLKRLTAVPWTALCIRCQEAADHHGAEVLESVDGAAVKVA